MATTIHTEVEAIERVLLRGAREAFVDAEKVDREWRGLDYRGPPDIERAVAEYEAFTALIEDSGAELVWAGAAADGGAGPDLTLDSIYVRDGVVLSDAGAVLCSMGKAQRRAEPAALRTVLEREGIPVIGGISGSGRLEGGDVCWMGPRVMTVGEGYRTNAEGITQLRAALGDQLDELVVVPLPHWKGPSDVFHLMSILSPVDRHCALVYAPLLPVRFRRWLLDRGFTLVEVPDEEFATMGCNVLALSPGRVLTLEGNPETRNRLEQSGIECLTYAGAEISGKGEGGPTCLTRPLARRPPPP